MFSNGTQLLLLSIDHGPSVCHRWRCKDAQKAVRSRYRDAHGLQRVLFVTLARSWAKWSRAGIDGSTCYSFDIVSGELLSAHVSGETVLLSTVGTPFRRDS